MTTQMHVCQGCDELITDPDDAVLVGHEAGNSGPGWDIWAHRAHVREGAMPDPALVRIVSRVLLTRAFPADG